MDKHIPIPLPNIQLSEQKPTAPGVYQWYLVGPMGEYYGTLEGASPLFAKSVVRACNNFEGMLEALKDCVELITSINRGYESGDIIVNARQAIANAEKE